MQGLDEEELRQFVAKFAGRHWEEFFEALFGYEAKLAARAVLLRGGAAGVREKHAAWREPLIARDRPDREGPRRRRERKLLQAVERPRLAGRGRGPEEAEAGEGRGRGDGRRRTRSARPRPSGCGPGPAARGGRNCQQACGTLMRGRATRDFVFDTSKARPRGQVFGLFVGPHVRAMLAAVLLARVRAVGAPERADPGGRGRAQALPAVEAKDLAQCEATPPTRTAATDR